MPRKSLYSGLKRKPSSRALRRDGQSHDIGFKKAKRVRVLNVRKAKERHQMSLREAEFEDRTRSPGFDGRTYPLGPRRNSLPAELLFFDSLNFPAYLSRYAAAVVQVEGGLIGNYQLSGVPGTNGVCYSIRLSGRSPLVQIVSVNHKLKVLGTKDIDWGVAIYRLSPGENSRCLHFHDAGGELVSVGGFERRESNRGLGELVEPNDYMGDLIETNGLPPGRYVILEGKLTGYSLILCGGFLNKVAIDEVDPERKEIITTNYCGRGVLRFNLELAGKEDTNLTRPVVIEDEEGVIHVRARNSSGPNDLIVNRL